MEFYLNNLKVDVLNGASFSIKKDETLDSGKLELTFNTTKTPISAMTDLKIVDGNETYNFVVMSDVVEVASKNPIAYKHTIEFVQNTKKFSKIQVRNTQFSQPAKDSLKCGYNALYYYNSLSVYTMSKLSDMSYVDYSYSYSMEISEKHKVKNAYARVNTKFIKYISETVLSSEYNFTKQDECPALTISFDIYCDDTLFQSVSKSFNDGDIIYLNSLTSGVYTIKNVVVSKEGLSSYVNLDMFLINITICADVYYYSLYDVLNILKNQIALEDDQNTGGQPYNLPTTGDFYTTLVNTIAPNLTFTQCTLFDCLEQIFMYLDGYPVLTKDKILDIRYFNDNNGNVVSLSPSDNKKALSEKRYVNGLITDFQKADINNVLTYPSKKTFSSIQNKDIGVNDDSKLIMRVDYPIYKLNSVKTFIKTIYIPLITGSVDSYTTKTYIITFNDYIDLVNNIVPYDIYVNLETATSDWRAARLCRENCLYYKQNENSIDCGSTFKQFITTEVVMPYATQSSIAKLLGIAPNNTLPGYGTFDDIRNNFKYQIEYETLANGRLLIEGTEDKFNGAERLDIGQGASDIMKMGLNLLGTSIKTGVNTLVRTEQFHKNDSSKIKVGSIFYEDGNKYIATKVDEMIFGDFVYQTIEYSKNFNKLSQFIALDQKKRFNEVDSSLTLRSEDVYKEYLYFSTSVPGIPLTKNHFEFDFILKGLQETFKLNPTNDTKIDFVSCSTENLDGTSNEKYGNVWLPIIQYGSGNALCYEMSFSSPINANSNFQYVESLGKWYSTYVLYTSDDAFADKFTINYYNQIATYQTSNLPKIDDEMISSDYATKVGGFSNLLYYKKPNEIFALNHELLCLPYKNEDIFIGERFIKYNGLIGNSVPKKELKLFLSTSELYSILDKEGIGSETIGTFSINIEYVGFGLYKAQIYDGDNLYQLTKNIKSWAICDENNNIYISCNQDLTINSNIFFYIFTSHLRL